MASKTFHLNTDPHEIIVGDYKFLFEPEANGAEFASAYAGLVDAQKSVSTAADGSMGPQDLKTVSGALKTFLSTFMKPESAVLFSSARLPDRILVGMVEFLAGVYTGGNGPSTSSSES